MACLLVEFFNSSKVNAEAYRVLAAGVLTVHLAWIAFVIAGALWTRGRRWLTVFHLLSLAWGIIVELAPVDCPLTLLEWWFERNAGFSAYRGGCLIHYLSAMVYPDLPDWLLTVLGVGVCLANLIVYARRATAGRLWTSNIQE